MASRCPERDRIGGQCYYCRKRGHIASQCPERDKGGGQRYPQRRGPSGLTENVERYLSKLLDEKLAKLLDQQEKMTTKLLGHQEKLLSQPSPSATVPPPSQQEMLQALKEVTHAHVL